MVLLHQSLEPDDLKELSQEDLDHLLGVMRHELYNSDQIKGVLKARVQARLEEMRQERGETD